MIPREMIEAAARGHCIYSVGGWEGHWNICRNNPDTGDFIEVQEVVESDYVTALKRCAFLNAESALTAALSSQWRGMEEIAEECEQCAQAAEAESCYSEARCWRLVAGKLKGLLPPPPAMKE